MTKLSLANLEIIAARASVPKYRREQLTPGIVRIGVGNFHRAHLAVYLNDLNGASADPRLPLQGGE